MKTFLFVTFLITSSPSWSQNDCQELKNRYLQNLSQLPIDCQSHEDCKAVSLLWNSCQGHKLINIKTDQKILETMMTQLTAAHRACKVQEEDCPVEPYKIICLKGSCRAKKLNSPKTLSAPQQSLEKAPETE
ncbi:MAG: hypothetical protein H6621_12375 [Halobacteriovoraceae bacterium]|nr:hypothetical protein [Halobacteriovoraceae bacterium]